MMVPEKINVYKGCLEIINYTFIVLRNREILYFEKQTSATYICEFLIQLTFCKKKCWATTIFTWKEGFLKTFSDFLRCTAVFHLNFKKSAERHLAEMLQDWCERNGPESDPATSKFCRQGCRQEEVSWSH